MQHIKVLSVGGSIIAPQEVDTSFLHSFYQAMHSYLEADQKRKLVFVTGGGAPARTYQRAYREIVEVPEDEEQDWIGIEATRLNARLLKGIFSHYCRQEVVSDPTAVSQFPGRVMVASGWKPGFSTDNDAVLLAEKFGADTVVNLSNIEKIYTADPKEDPGAEPIDAISWADFRSMVGDEWTPGRNLPFDPVAAKRGERIGLRVVCAGGRDIENIRAILEDRSFTGSVIGPD
mgnify:CR=1 FL=1